MKTPAANISRNISKMLLIPAGMAVLSLPVCAIAQEWFAILPFCVTALISVGLSSALHRLGKPTERSSQSQILVTVGLGWAIVAAIGALPIWFTALSLGTEATPTVTYFSNGLNALFEGVSGFTSAGLTMVIQPSQLPISLQWWRSLMQWVGGVGVIVLAVALLTPTQDQYVMYQAEGRQSRIRLTITRTVRRIWFIYTGYTVAGVLLLRVTGMEWWPALNHGMSAISTGGFSVTDNSMAAYSAITKLSIIIIMIFGAISFSIHDQLISRKNLSALWQDRQHFFLIGACLIGTAIVGIEHYRFIGQFAWVDSAFQWVSALTTCGFASQSVQNWSDNNKLLLSVAMVFGGAAGSTAGGLKLNRVLTLIESVSWRFRRTTLSPRQMVVREVNGQKLSPEQASRQVEDASALAVMWVTLILLSVLLLVPLVPAEYGLSDVIFESAAALGSAGLSVGITGPSLHWAGKCLLMILMWMGRLEIIPVAMLLYAPWQYFRNRLR